MARRRNEFLDLLAFRAAQAGLWLARALPYRARLAFGGALGRAAVRIPRYRRRIAANLDLVMPELGPAERVQVARQTGVNAVTSGAACPSSRQPELKHAAVRIAKAARDTVHVVTRPTYEQT